MPAGSTRLKSVPALVICICPFFCLAGRAAETRLNFACAPANDLYVLVKAGGVDAARFEGVHAPIGLDIGAVTPQEIAVSILAELIAVRRGKAQTPALAAASLKWTPKALREPAPR